MGYDVSKKTDVGHGKITTSLTKPLFLRKINAEKPISH